MNTLLFILIVLFPVLVFARTLKNFKSIKWRLQLWYGLILVAVLAALGMTAHQLEWNTQYNRLNDELGRRFVVVANALHPHGPEHGHPPFGGPPPDRMPGDLPPPDDPRPFEFHLPQQDAALFDSSDPHDFYYIVDRNGKEIDHSANVPGREMLDGTTKYQWLQLARPLPSGETIIIGCFIGPELHQSKISALTLSGVGAIVLFFGLAGGWWISSRAIRPVEDISATAVKIAAGDLSQRINTAETESELGQLAAVLNSTFARLEAAFAQQKQFASDAAHELRTPVSVILTQTQTTLGREREAKDYKQTIEACQRAAQRMRKLITSLLELARLDAGQEQMKRLRFDLSKTIADGVELIHPLADERGVKLVNELSPLEVAGDSERLGQVVTNLLTNAIEYNHDGGKVTVTLKAENGMAVLTVSDTGQGIPAEDLPRVFERFYRVDKSRSSGNAGLGLAICKAIVSAHGGSIDVASEENAGTKFTVRLPL